MGLGIAIHLYRAACTHPSYANEHGGEHSEKLEFLGDSVLQLCVTELLVAALPDCNEGELSQARHSLVNNSVLAELAQGIGLHQILRVGKGERLVGERMLANCFEAMLGALYLDQGIEVCKSVVEVHFKPRLIGALAVPPKRRLHEWSQKTYQKVPEYSVVNVEGPQHQRVYHVSVQINNAVVAYGRASTKREATVVAAQNAVKILELK